LKSKKPDPIKGKRKLVPIKPPEKKLSFEEIVQKYDEYIHGPERFNKILSELGSSHVDDEGEASCNKKNDCTVYTTTKDSPKSKKNKKKVSPLKRK
jgi:hypothetical protein